MPPAQRAEPCVRSGDIRMFPYVVQGFRYTNINHPTSVAPEAIQKSNQSCTPGMWAALLNQGCELRPAFATISYPLCTRNTQEYFHKASWGTWKQGLHRGKRCPPTCCPGDSKCQSPRMVTGPREMLGRSLPSLPLLLGVGLGPR